MADPKTIFYTVRIPRELKDLMKEDAAQNSRSLNAHFVEVMRGYLKGELVPAEKLLSNPGVVRLLRAAVVAANERNAHQTDLFVAPAAPGNSPKRRIKVKRKASK